MKTKIKGILIDVNYKEGKIFLTIKSGSKVNTFYEDFKDYFYSEKNEESENIIKKIKEKNKNIKIEEVRIEGKSLYKIEKVNGLENLFYSKFEHDIPAWKKYLIEKKITPMDLIELEVEEDKILDVKDIKSPIPKLKVISFDIETYAPFIVPRISRDPIIFASYAGEKEQGVITYKKGNRDFEILVKDEKELIEKLCEKLNNYEVIVGYNSSSFDIPYLMKRAEKINARFWLGNEEINIKKLTTGRVVRTSGIIHFDLFYLIRLLANAQAIKTQRYSLEEIYEEILGEKKIDLEEEKMCEIYDNDETRGIYLDYSLSDAVATYKIFEKLYPLIVEICKISKIPLKELNNITSSQLVESLLFEYSHDYNFIIPSKPEGEELLERSEEKVIGAYVKIPEPGIYEKIAVLDFRSLYPSIIVAHNIDPRTLNCEHEECKKNISPTGSYFCLKKKGIIPITVENLLNLRKKLKEELKRTNDPLIKARVAALKIILNSFYGMFRYIRSRWYSRECAESITTWGRKYILDIAKKAEEKGFKVIYMDTDSTFLTLGEKNKEDVIKFVEEVNKEIPEAMELEIENFYERGVFVEKKTKEEIGARKKYALIDENGKIKIRGFELVRRDWCKFARDTQLEVLYSILKEGSKEKAIEIVRNRIKQLKEGKFKKEDLVIYTQLRKGKYKVTSPEFSAYEKARKRGVKIPIGSIIGYVITKNGKSISEKAEIAQFAKDFDIEYYINNQILPAVLKILGALGYSEDDIKYYSKQTSLGDW
jgi:DNA polymerase I